MERKVVDFSIMEVCAIASCALMISHNTTCLLYQANRKRNWFFTYNAPIVLTEQNFREEGLEIDEIAYTQDRALNYVYFHLDKKVRQTTVEAFLAVVGSKHGVRVNEMFGFDAISSCAQGGTIHSHPGFWTLMKHEKDRHGNFKSWINGRPDARKGYMLLKKLAAVELANLEVSSLLNASEIGPASSSETTNHGKVSSSSDFNILKFSEDSLT